jgi:hypothetical protein
MCTCKDVGFMTALEPHGHGKSFRFMECIVLVKYIFKLWCKLQFENVRKKYK